MRVQRYYCLLKVVGKYIFFEFLGYKNIMDC
jgi:hypothetical protein